jgi:8-oxo-dGTP pyrophosphatase MutT (NUDIX family)
MGTKTGSIRVSRRSHDDDRHANEFTLDAAMRHTWEETGLDLQEKDYLCIGQLDDREITTSLGKRLLMILSPFGWSRLVLTLCDSQI